MVAVAPELKLQACLLATKSSVMGIGPSINTLVRFELLPKVAIPASHL